MASPSLNEVRPVLGPQARKAMQTDVGGRKRLKLYVLLAAYADAGEASPSAATLCKRLGIDIKTLDALLRRLERDGHLRVAWRQGPSQRNVYSLCDGRRP